MILFSVTTFLIPLLPWSLIDGGHSVESRIIIICIVEHVRTALLREHTICRAKELLKVSVGVSTHYTARDPLHLLAISA